MALCLTGILRVEDCKQEIANRKLQAGDCKQKIASSRLEADDCTQKIPASLHKIACTRLARTRFTTLARTRLAQEDWHALDSVTENWHR